jgi:hypothetical protein
MDRPAGIRWIVKARAQAVAQALPVLIPFAAIVVGSFAGAEWLRSIGMWSLAAVVFIAILRGKLHNIRDLISPWMVALAAGALLAVVLALAIPGAPGSSMVIPLLAGAVGALCVVIGRILYGLIRLNAGS